MSPTQGKGELAPGDLVRAEGLEPSLAAGCLANRRCGLLRAALPLSWHHPAGGTQQYRNVPGAVQARAPVQTSPELS